MKNNWATFRIITTYIGSVVGAGFASGQEILKFFSYYGIHGMVGIILASILFSILGSIILILGQKLNTTSYNNVLTHVVGEKIGKLLDVLITFFLFSTLSVMLAGSGAIFNQYLNLPYFVGSILTLILVILTVSKGLEGVITANVIIVPVLMILISVISYYSLNFHGLEAQGFSFYHPEKGAAPHWLLSTFLYVAYNLILAIAILVPLGKAESKTSVLIKGGLWGGIGLGILAFFINLVIMSHIPEIGLYEVPLLYVTNFHGTPLKIMFALILWLEIFTTIIGNLYGVALRLSYFSGWSYKKIIVTSIPISLVLSQLGFSKLLGILYPLFGYISLVFIFFLLFVPFRGDLK